MTTYQEDFDYGTAGWWGWDGNHKGFRELEVRDGTMTTRSPWWIDYNHAPPGCGYLHMIFCLNTKGPFGEQMKEAAGPNGFTLAGCPTRFTDARMTVRIKGELLERGAKLVLLLQGAHEGRCTGWALTGQPIEVTPGWSEQTIHLTPDESQWTCLGARHDRVDYYGRAPLETVLNDVNINLMLILYPLTIAPMGPLEGDPHLLRPERDYPVWRSQLPEGYISLDRVTIHFA